MNRVNAVNKPTFFLSTMFSLQTQMYDKQSAWQLARLSVE